jgi:transcriptional regulator with XRE-family HTH domain
MEEFNPKDIAQDIAKRVTALRLQRAWTREVLAEHAGVNVYTLKHFERTGQISLHRLIAVAFALEMNAEIERLFKPRQRVDVNNWQLEPQTTRKRGRRRSAQESVDAAMKVSIQTVAEEEMVG